MNNGIVESRVGTVSIFVAPEGNDNALGTPQAPFATLQRARDALRNCSRTDSAPVEILLLPGIHRLTETLELDSRDSGCTEQPVIYRAVSDEPTILTGAQPLDLDWVVFHGGIWQATVPVEAGIIDTLIVDGQIQTMARYPNYNPQAKILNGTAADALDPSRVARWKNPAGGYIHALHSHQWGDFHAPILGKDADGQLLVGPDTGNNRRMGFHEKFRFVENIFEELDAPGEWFFDRDARQLYFFAPKDLDPNQSMVETVATECLIRLNGTSKTPVRHIHFEGITFRFTSRTFLKTTEPLLRGDWMIYRGGAAILEGTEDCTFSRCRFDRVGGNAVMVSGFNRRVHVESCLFESSGASDVVFVGRPSAVRSPLFEYAQTQPVEALDLTPGPQSEDYPSDCQVHDCLMTRCGRTEKQSAGVEIAIAKGIIVSHCSIYDVPRAGININDGCFGGHRIEGCDVFDTVKETGDHGAFNSWGRDRFWVPDIGEINARVAAHPELPLLDAIEPVTLCYNRWSCDHGWDIDLDDGSSNYHIHHNLCLAGGLKNREGYRRIVENNIMVNNTFHPHVWQENSEDVFRKNIVFDQYADIGMPAIWGAQIDRNFLHTAVPYSKLSDKSHADQNSLSGDALFLDPAVGDYRVAADSPAVTTGFENFPMDQFGVVSPWLKSIARRPELPTSATDPSGAGGRSAFEYRWLGAVIKNVTTLGERSVGGIDGIRGIVVLAVEDHGVLAGVGVRKSDILLGWDGQDLDSIDDLARLCQMDQIEANLRFWRNQKEVLFRVSLTSGSQPERILVRHQWG